MVLEREWKPPAAGKSWLIEEKKAGGIYLHRSFMRPFIFHSGRY